MMPLIIKGEDEELISKKAEKILKDVKISNRANHFQNELSGGEQQRVVLEALIAETKLILADEPTGNLDFKTSKDIFSFFKIEKLKKQYYLQLTIENLLTARITSCLFLKVI